MSNGYRATRVNLASLAGDTVRFRFRFASDAAVGYFPGWVVDDVTAYTCGAGGGDTTPPETTIDSGPPDKVKIKHGNKTKVVYEVSANEAGTIEASVNGGVWQGPLDQGKIKVTDLTKGFYTIEFRARRQVQPRHPHVYLDARPRAGSPHPNVHFEVDDGTDTDSENITITVTGGGDNDPPETTMLV